MIAALTRLPVLFLCMIVAGSSLAAQLPEPTGATILTVTGTIANTNDGDVARFDRGMLEAIGLVELSTMTPWYDDEVRFEGVLMSALMKVVGAEGTEIVATALNDYRSAIPMADFETYGVVLAFRRDGELMPIRDKGPLFIVYPYDSTPELQNETYYARSVWQVRELSVR